jgi:hypothetical protein
MALLTSLSLWHFNFRTIQDSKDTRIQLQQFRVRIAQATWFRPRGSYCAGDKGQTTWFLPVVNVGQTVKGLSLRMKKGELLTVEDSAR